MTSPQEVTRRADARRSREAILEAALRVLDADPDASVGAIAAEAGVTRQTVYAHFPSRQLLLGALLDRVTDEALAAMDAAALEEGPAVDALLRLLDAGNRTAGRYPALMRRIALLPVSPGDDVERHAPVTDRLMRVIRRGQRSGELDTRLSPEWLAAVAIRLGHLASEEVDAGRMSNRKAKEVLHVSLLRVLAAPIPRKRARS
ncbi:MAG TPA: TetR/AcrR family transcriptional regulator [Gemmatimonadaceae bacterium]|jgi:Bacterial regulatory proteins, tetR family.